MASTLMITGQAGDALANGVHCPLCEVDQSLGDGLSLEWIDTDAGLILNICPDRQLIAANEF